jgi:2-dehydro-3-deoxyphosphogluconate aldolase/(4S)-4-hydroxy-2-oxoglutarate aldolase
MSGEQVDTIVARIREAGVIAVLRRLPPDTAYDIVDALLEGGLKAVELTMDSPAAAEVIAGVRERAGNDLLIGAGTVMTAAQVDEALEAGADFLVSPHLDESLVAKAQEAERLFIPGVMTATEVARAQRAGAEVLKLFPAGSLGPGYLKDLLGPFRGTPFIPTGGITPERVGDYLRAGALAVGVGSALTPATAISQRDWAAIRQLASTLVRQVDEVRSR